MKKSKYLRISAFLYVLAVTVLSLADYFMDTNIREFFGGAAFVMLVLYFFSKVPLNTSPALPVKRMQDQAVEQSQRSWISLKSFVVVTLPLALAYFSCFL